MHTWQCSRAKVWSKAGAWHRRFAKYRYAATLLDQIGQKYPNWQPLIVEYRKKRTSESIARLEQQVGNQPPDASGNGGAVVEPDVPMPQKDQSTASLPTEPLPQRTDDAASDIKGRDRSIAK